MIFMLPLCGIDSPSWVVGEIAYVLFTTQGIYMPLLRISEPFFFRTVSGNLQNIIQRLYGLPPIDTNQTRETVASVDFLETETGKSTDQFDAEENKLLRSDA
jgi:hypothetical protein